jgi:hypothetical protein
MSSREIEQSFEMHLPVSSRIVVQNLFGLQKAKTPFRTRFRAEISRFVTSGNPNDCVVALGNFCRARY